MSGLRIAFFGSSLVLSCWNGAATYYRGLLRVLAGRGARIRFYEPDVRTPAAQAERDTFFVPGEEILVTHTAS